jgi:hypothetical protein
MTIFYCFQEFCKSLMIPLTFRQRGEGRQ